MNKDKFKDLFFDKPNYSNKSPIDKLNWYTKLLIFVDVCAVLCFILAYAPITNFKNWLINTANGTGQHKYFAYVLYSENTVSEVVNANTTSQPEKFSDPDQITFVDYSNIDVYESVYEQQVLQKDEGNDLYKVFAINEGSFSGYITVIYQPERLELVISKNRYGNSLSDLSRMNNAIVAINGGGYHIEDDYSKYPCDNMILDGQIYYDKGGIGQMVGMNEDGVLMLMKSTAQEAVDAGMVWALDFGPFLVVNGNPAKFTGDGGMGFQPRTAIGQRKDGIVLLLTIDGRGGNGSQGASVKDMTEIFVRYGCINACNLDGGGSSVLIVENQLINHPVSYQGEGERNILDGIILR